MKKAILLCAAIGSFCLLNIHIRAQAPDWQWAQGAGDNSYDYAYSVTVNASGNSYVAGYFNTSITFGTSYTLTSNGSTDLYIVNFDPNGNVIWAEGTGGSGDDRAYSVATDASGNCFMAGCFKSPSVSFDTFNLTNAGGNTYDVFLAKYDANGSVIWAKGAGGTGDDRAWAVAVDKYGNIYLTGYFVSSSISFDTFTLTNSGGVDIFTVKFSQEGAVQWAKSAAGSDWDFGTAIAADEYANCYLTGYFRGSDITFGTVTLTNSNSSFYDMCLVKYGPDGTVLWAKSAGGSGEDVGSAVAVNGAGDCFVVGYFKSSTMTFGNTTLTNAGTAEDMYLAKYDPDGTLVWANSAGGTQGDVFSGVTVDSLGNICVTGYFKSPAMTFGTSTLTNAAEGLADIFLGIYDQSGSPRWAKSAGGTGDDYAVSVTVDSSRSCFLAGYFGSPSITFGSITLTNAGTSDMFISKLENYSGINDPTNPVSISVFPNPASGYLTINFTQKAIIEILNIEGQVIQSIFNDDGETTTDISALPGGLYFLKAKTEEGIIIRKFIKQ